MKNKLYLLSLVVVVFLSLVGWIGWTGYAQKSNPARQTWEYKSIVIHRSAFDTGFSAWFEDAKALPARPVNMIPKSKELGEQGWELVSVTPLSSEGGSTSAYPGFTNDIIYWFKRPKP